MKNICYIKGVAVVLPKVVCIGPPKEHTGGFVFRYVLDVTMVGNEDLVFSYNTLEEALIERDKLVQALEIMCSDVDVCDKVKNKK